MHVKILQQRLFSVDYSDTFCKDKLLNFNVIRTF